MDQIISSFKEKKKLNSDIWDGVDGEIDQVKLNAEIRTKLMQIAETFVESLKLENLEIEDILFLGSLSAYNWSKYSDVDLHILVDKSQIDGDDALIEEFFDAKKRLFNDNHDITIKGFEVELYIQDINEENAANGVYSVLYNTWNKIPETETVNVNKSSIIQKVKDFNKQLRTIKGMGDSDNKLMKIEALKEKIRKFRKAGLDGDGEYSTENLVFKYLRRSGFLEELAELKIQVIDNMLSLNEGNFNNSDTIYIIE